ncbi:putative membrane protein [Asticcacaulis biprosthecium C19]|uniref:Putative membrane protein n=1 Tax=Asticcacaulis biprosthecium C19 TaxID=715226 RepID=F4QIE8_9CAUL|nr:hypothetical protein [Asticcacaulis biprosthecium]EGF92937.1 putative membrane protein [Asticcacaulis biprosthecium C19]
MSFKRFLVLILLTVGVLAVWQILATVLLSFGTPFWLVAITFLPAIAAWWLLARLSRIRV